MRHTVSHTVIPETNPAIDAERFRDIYLYISVVYIASRRIFGYARMGKNHSHSIVPGGFDVTSYTTRFTPFTSLMIRVAARPKKFMS